MGYMFDRTTDYEAVYLGEFPTHDDKAGPALRWAVDRARGLGARVTVVAPTKNHFRASNLLAALPASMLKETPQTIGRFPRVGPVAVSFWPTAKDLEQLDGADGLVALAVVPWNEPDIETWRRARGAVDLLGRVPVLPAPSLSDPVVEAAMKDVTAMVNLSTGLGHPRDRSMAIHAFKILKRNGHRYDPQEIRAWAMANGWAADDARELSEYAAGVQSGKAYRAGPSGWQSQIIRSWRKGSSR